MTKKESNSFTNIIWINTSFIGDLILNSGAMHLISKNFPHYKQFLISNKVGSILYKTEPLIINSFVFEKKNIFHSLKSASAIKKELKYLGLTKKNSIIIQVHLSSRSSILAKYLGFPVITYNESSFSILAKYKTPRITLLHECSRISLLTEHFGVLREEIFRTKPRLKYLKLNQRFLELHNLHNNNINLIGLATSSHWNTKKWPSEHYIELLIELHSFNPKSYFLLLGTYSEKKEIDYIEKEVNKKIQNNNRLINLAGKTSIDDLKGIYPLLSLLISNDSSPIHFASSFNIPTIAIFGSTTASLGFTPLSDISLIIENQNLNCRPCSLHGPKRCPLKHFKCMKDLKPLLVLKEIITFINQYKILS